MSTVLVLQPAEDDPLGPMHDWLVEAGADVRLVRPYTGDPVPADLAGVDALICLGGPMDADADAEHPWLVDVRALLGAAVRGGTPVLAICLGAQLLALATGGGVRRMPDGPEAGLRLVAKRDAAAADPLLGALPFTPDVMQFHSDEVHRLPADATLLAAGQHCPHQAFRVGPAAWGLQFHIETTPALVRRWMAESPETAATMPPAQHHPGVLEDGHADLAETWRPIVATFVEIADAHRSASPHRPASTRIDLPLLGES